MIAALSLAVSGATFYYSNFHPAELETVAGPHILVYYPPDGGIAFYLPVAFINHAANTGTVYRLGISLTRKSPGADTFYVEWRSFAVSNNEKIVLAEPAHALAVQGDSTVAKIAWLLWRADSTPPFVLRQGDYTMAVHVWTQPVGKPETQLHELTVDDAAFADLERARTTKSYFLTDLTLDRQIPPNRHLTGYEANSLLGVPQQ